jgi:hypothetical protein
MIRFGLLALVANFMVVDILQSFPLTNRASAWYAGISLASFKHLPKGLEPAPPRRSCPRKFWHEHRT